MFDFPSPATLNQTATAPNGAVFVWDGAKWTTAENAVMNPGGGLYLPLSGVTPMTGPLTLAANATLPMHAVPLQQLNAALSAVPPGGSIQAAHDALPATGGTIMLSANTTYAITATVNITKPNVHLSAPSWATILRRDPAFSTGSVLLVSGAGCTVEGFTVDGNSVAQDNYFELNVNGDNSLVSRMQIINSHGPGHLALSGNNSRVTGSTITGLGLDIGTNKGYGIWAIGHQTVEIDNNTITGTGVDAIGVDGNGSRVIGNRVFGCHCYVAGPGGQIAVYPLAGDQSGGNGVTIVGNTIGTGGAGGSYGIEVDGPNALVAGNYIDSQQSNGIILTHQGTMVTGNTVRNSPTSSNIDAILCTIGATNFVITGNQIFDDRVTKVMRAGVWIDNTAADNYAVAGNAITGSSINVAIVDHGQGKNKTIVGNTGYDTQVPAIASAATLVLPMNPVISLTGNATITAIDLTSGAATGRTITMIPTGTASFVGGAGGIANSIAATPGVPLRAVFDGTSWYITTSSPPALPLTGGGLSGGLNFGSANAASSTDLSRHINLNTGAPTGFGVTSGRLNYVIPAGNRHIFNVGGTDIAGIGSDGYDGPIGQLAANLGSFSTLKASGNIGFYGTAPIAKPTVAGAKGSNAALASLLTALAAFGLVTDSTTA